MRYSHRQLVAVCLLTCAGMALAQDGPSDAELKQANNPLANMKAFNVQNYYAPDLIDADGTSNTAWLRYAQPFGRVLLRASLPFQTMPTSTGTESGMGDLNAFAAFMLTPDDSSTPFGVGPLVAAPTASDDALGLDGWQAGFAAVYFNAKSAKLQYGALVTWQTDVSGDEDSSLGVIQPFAFWQLGRGTYLRAAPSWVLDFENDRYNVPIGLGIGKVVKVNKIVFNGFIEPQFTAFNQGAGNPAAQVFIGLNMQFLD
jgi:hypothetical protein